jgi:hypothetical protein
MLHINIIRIFPVNFIPSDFKPAEVKEAVYLIKLSKTEPNVDINPGKTNCMRTHAIQHI